MKPPLRNLPDHFILDVGTNDLSSKKSSMETTKSIISQECWLKNETHDVSVSTIILKIDDTNLNKKGMGDNLHLKELSKEKNIFLSDNLRKIKAQHLHKGKLHLTKYGSRVLSNNVVSKIYKVLHWQIDRDISNANVVEYNFKDDLSAKKYNECNVTLTTIRSDNVNKLIFPHLNINSIRNKFKFLAKQFKGNRDILMSWVTKIDESFPKKPF